MTSFHLVMPLRVMTHIGKCLQRDFAYGFFYFFLASCAECRLRILLTVNMAVNAWKLFDRLRSWSKVRSDFLGERFIFQSNVRAVPNNR